MNKVYLGRAMKYPFELKKGSAVLQYDDALIQQSITILLNTPVGTRFMLRSFGSRCREVLFEPNDEVQEDLLSYFISSAIGQWEKRVAFVSCEFTRPDEKDEAVLFCEISYRNLKSNEINSFVYPFYKTLKY